MKIYTFLLLIPLTCFAQTHDLKNCLYVSSYHAGYEWNDGIERGLHSILDGKCHLSKFYMDIKRRKMLPQIQQAVLEAKAFITNKNPDIVIACDDNAVKYPVEPYYKDADLPGWDNQRAADYALIHANTFTVTNYQWMNRYAMLAVTKIADEQGEWAGKVALAILEGEQPINIPIVVNRRKLIYTNPALLDKAKIKLPPSLIHQSKIVVSE